MACAKAGAGKYSALGGKVLSGLTELSVTAFGHSCPISGANAHEKTLLKAPIIER